MQSNALCVLLHAHETCRIISELEVLLTAPAVNLCPASSQAINVLESLHLSKVVDDYVRFKGGAHEVMFALQHS